MRVLITGGYGFIGSHVAEKFYKEGYEIHILDNLSSGKKENVTIKHKSYHLSIEDIKCRDIFSSYAFDAVIHLAGQSSPIESTYNPEIDALSNLVGFINIFQNAKKYNVKKFIFASSTLVYDLDKTIPIDEDAPTSPKTPYSINKLTAETYCQKFAEDSEMDVICLRLTNIYGPRQQSGTHGGVISQLVHNVVSHVPIEIHGSGQQMRDFLYVSDAAFAIYHAVKSISSGIYNLSSNSSHSILEIVEILENIHGHLTVSHISGRTDDFHTAQFDNKKIKFDFDWSPLYSLEEGLKKTYEWTSKQETNSSKKVKHKKKWHLPDYIKSTRPYIENIMVFIILSMIMLNTSTTIFSTFEFGVFYIMIIGTIYGNRQGFLGVIMASLLLVAEYLNNGREIFSLLYDTTFLFEISTFLFIGIVVGYSVQRKNNKIEEQFETIEELEKRYAFLEEIHEEVREVKDELQFRLKNNEDSFGKIYSIIKELDDLEPEKIFTKTVDVVEKIMRCSGVSIYVFNNYHSFLRLVAYSNADSSALYGNSIKVEESKFVQQIIQTGKPYINYDLESNIPLMSAPIFYNNEIRAIITINHLSFENFSTYYENLFIVVKELIQASLWRAFEFIKVSEETRYFENTNILHYNIFESIVNTKEEAWISYNMPYKILKLPAQDDQFQQLGEKVVKLLRETDYISYKDGFIYILLSNTNDKDLPFILQRFQKEGLHMLNAQVMAVSNI